MVADDNEEIMFTILLGRNNGWLGLAAPILVSLGFLLILLGIFIDVKD